MTDDIVTRLREHANGDFEKTSEFMLGLAADEIERLRKTIMEINAHLSDALYSDEWKTREYAIAAQSRVEMEHGHD
jgi:hypothetical protein